MHIVDSDSLEDAREVDHIGDDEIEHQCQQHKRTHQGEKDAPVGERVEGAFLGAINSERKGHQKPDGEHGCHGEEESSKCRDDIDGEQNPCIVSLFAQFEVNNQRHGRDGQQVQQVNSDGKTYQIGDKNNPAMRIGTRLGIVVLEVPLQDAPEHQCSEEGGHSIDLALYGREPEGVGEGVGQTTHEGGTEHGNHATGSHLAALGHQLTAQHGDGPEQKHNRQTATNG